MQKENKMNPKMIRMIIILFLAIILLGYTTWIWTMWIGVLAIPIGVSFIAFILVRNGKYLIKMMRREKILEDELRAKSYTTSPLISFRELSNSKNYNSDTIARVILTTSNKIRNNPDWSEAAILYEKIEPSMKPSDALDSGSLEDSIMMSGAIKVSNKLPKPMIFIKLKDGSYRFSHIEIVSARRVKKFQSSFAAQGIPIVSEIKIGHSKTFLITVTILIALTVGIVVIGVFFG